jgi:glycosyltransferase involved in cell wall biosynthesis
MREGARTLPLWRACLTLSDRFLVLSKEMVAHYREVLKPTSDVARNAAKFEFIYSIVDFSKFFPQRDDGRAALRARLGIEAGRPALVYVGRFDDKKAQLDFIREAGPLLAAKSPDAITYLVGDFDPEREEYAAACAAEVKRLGLEDRIRFMGYSARSADWYGAADVVVLASRREGLPRCVIEGIACGAPVVAFDVCSVREVLEAHECGVAVPHGDYRKLASEIAALLQDGERLAAYRSKGPAVAAALFDGPANAARYSQLAATLAR